jgi:4-amino-4-deoxy-L-arabinose transferase-like glycosyltransferase
VLPFLRFGQSLWSDEAASVWLARLPLPTLLLSLCDPHPAGYYLALRLWLWGGETEPWLRLSSLLTGVGAALLVYFLGRDLGGRAWAWLAALLLVLHPLQVWYAAEVRMYLLAQTLGLAGVWLAWRWFDRAHRQGPPLRASLAYGAAMTLAFGADYAALLPFTLSQAVWLARGRPRPRLWLGAQAIVLLAAGALWLRPSQIFALGHSYPATFLAIVLQPLARGLTPAIVALILRLGLILLLIGLLAVGWGWPRLRPIDPRPPLRWLIIGSWLALLLLAAFPRLYSLKRQLVILLPYLALITAWAVWRLPRWQWASLLALSLVAALLLPLHRREAWDDLIDTLQREAQPQATVWVDELAWAGFDYYTRRYQAADLRRRALPFPGPVAPLFSQPRSDADLWLLLYPDAYRDLRHLLPPDFHSYFQLDASRQFAGLELDRYRARPQPIPPPPPPRLTQPETWGLHLLSPLSACNDPG